MGLEGNYVAGLFVRQDARSRGVGKELLDCAKAHRTQLSLSVYRKNERAAAFYQREGFVVLAAGVDANTGEPEYTMAWNRLG